MLTLFYWKLGWPLRSHFILIDVRINNMVILKHMIFFEKQLGFDDTLKYTISEIRMVEPTWVV